MLLCCSNLLRHLHLVEYGAALRAAVVKTIREGKTRTRDLGGYATTRDVSGLQSSDLKVAKPRFEASERAQFIILCKNTSTISFNI